MHKIDPAVLKQICIQKRILRVCNREMNKEHRRPFLLKVSGLAMAEAVAELQRLTNCEQYIIDTVLPVKTKHQYTQAAEVCLSYDGQLGFNFRKGGYIGEVYKTDDGTEYFVLAIV